MRVFDPSLSWCVGAGGVLFRCLEIVRRHHKSCFEPFPVSFHGSATHREPVTEGSNLDEVDSFFKESDNVVSEVAPSRRVAR